MRPQRSLDPSLPPSACRPPGSLSVARHWPELPPSFRLTGCDSLEVGPPAESANGRLRSVRMHSVKLHVGEGHHRTTEGMTKDTIRSCSDTR